MSNHNGLPKEAKKLTLKCSWFIVEESNGARIHANFFAQSFDKREIALSFFEANEWQNIIGWNDQVEEMIDFVKSRDTVIQKSFFEEFNSQNREMGSFAYSGNSESVWTGENITSIWKTILINETGSYCVAARPMTMDGAEFNLDLMGYSVSEDQINNDEIGIWNYISVAEMGGVLLFLSYWIWTCLHFSKIIFPAQKVICLYIFLFALNQTLQECIEEYVFSSECIKYRQFYSVYEIIDFLRTNFYRLFVIYCALGFGVTRTVPKYLMIKGISIVIALCSVYWISLYKDVYVVSEIFDMIQYEVSPAIWVYSICHLLKQCTSVTTYENASKARFFRRMLNAFIFIFCASPMLHYLSNIIFGNFDYRLSVIIGDLFTFMEKIAFPCYIMFPTHNEALAYNRNVAEEAQEKMI